MERSSVQKAFLYVETKSVLEPKGGELCQTVSGILSRTVTVRTPESVGAAVIAADAIITTLFLVRNYSMVMITFSRGETYPAAVVARDDRNHLAKLQPLALSSKVMIKEGRRLSLGRPRGIGEPLLVANVSGEHPAVEVAAMTYVTKVCERKESTWRIEASKPRGVAGGGVWNDSGEFVGLSLGERSALPEKLLEAAWRSFGKEYDSQQPESVLNLPRVYALSAEEVMNFVETKH